MSPPLKHAMIAAVLGCAAVCLHLPSTEYGFLNYDDGRVLTNHPELFAVPGLVHSLRAIVMEHHPREEPLLVRDVSWALDSRLFGFRNPRGYHTGNVMLHGIAVGLFYLLVLTLTRVRAAALLSTLFYLSLAIHVEPVAWVMGRKDLLAGCLTFATLLAQCRFMDSPTRTGRAAWYAVTLALVPLALLSKISAAALPGVMLLLGVLLPYVRGSKGRSEPFEWKQAGSWLLLVTPHLVITVLIAGWYKAQLTSFGILERGYNASFPVHVRNLLTVNPWALLRYLDNIFLPHRLSLFYAWPGVDVPLTWWFVAGAALTLTALIAGLVYLMLRHRDLLFFPLAFLALMMPYMNIVYCGIWVANRYLYTASGCLVALLAVPAARILRKQRRRKGAFSVVALGAAFILINVTAKLRYQPVWRDNETLWRYEMSLPNPRVEPFENLAAHYYTAAVTQTPGSGREALLESAAGVIEDARRQFRVAEDVPVSMYRLMYVEAICLMVRGVPAEQQIPALERVVKMRPDFENPLWELSILYYRLALDAADMGEREKLARTAYSYYGRYAAAPHFDGEFAARDAAMRPGFRRDFPFLAGELESEND